MINLTEAKAYSLHVNMWKAMEEKYGNCPNRTQRGDFKEEWCSSHIDGKVHYNCFLCEYDIQCNDFSDRCKDCPVNWNTDNGHCYGEAIDGVSGSAYMVMPISWVLSQERKVK